MRWLVIGVGIIVVLIGIAMLFAWCVMPYMLSAPPDDPDLHRR